MGIAQALLGDPEIIIMDEPTSGLDPNQIVEIRNLIKEIGKTKTVILLKGHVDVISDGSKVALNKTGNVYMAKGGMGDTLTGICAALVARKINQIDLFTAASAAAYINGRAGDIAARKLKEGLTTTDLINNIPFAIQGK